MNRKSLATLILILLFISTQSLIVSSAYRRNYEIPVKGNVYVLDVKLMIENIGDYGVISVYLAPEGGYAYGFTILKDPDENFSRVYIMAGSQNKWFDAGILNYDIIRLRLVVDKNSSKMIVLSYSYNNTFSLNFTPTIKRLYISVFNITSRASDYPSVYIEFLKIYVANTTLDKLNNTLLYNLNSSLDNIASLKRAITIEKQGINYTVNTESSVETGIEPNIGESVELDYLLIATIVFIAVILFLIVLLILNYMGKIKKGSPGP